MPIILRLDRVMADRKMSLKELSEKVGGGKRQSVQTEKRACQRHSLFHTGSHLRSAGLSARRYPGISENGGRNVISGRIRPKYFRKQKSCGDISQPTTARIISCSFFCYTLFQIIYIADACHRSSMVSFSFPIKPFRFPFSSLTDAPPLRSVFPVSSSNLRSVSFASLLRLVGTCTTRVTY